MTRVLPTLPLALLCLSGCASADLAGYPSLERRAIENRVNAPLPSPAGPVAVAPSAEDRTALAALSAQAGAGESAFRSALGSAQRRVEAARGQPVGSPAWFDAQAALSALEATRAPTLAALAELDRRHVAAELAGQSELAVLLAAEQARVANWVAAQTGMLERIGAALGTVG